MNRRMVFHTVGRIILLEAILLSLPALCSVIYKEKSFFAFLFSILIALVLGGGLILLSRPKHRVIYAKEGFAITTFAWLSLSLIGALPFFLSGQIPHFADAFFETVSGFTTTGASILSRVEDLDRGILFWRSFTHWVGGMGVLVFLMVFIPGISERSIHIARAEMPGPVVGKIVPKMRDTARILYLIYIVMTLLQVILLLLSGMDLFCSLTYTFGTAGTGGFGLFSDSAGSLTGPQQWIIAIFMLLFGVNFNLYFLILIRRFRSAFRSTELWAYVGIVAVATGIVFANVSQLYNGVEETLRHSLFQVSSIITTTGYSTVDFNLWPGMAKTVLLILMFIGGSAGSTAGGLKVSRVVLFFKNCHAEFRHMLHPRSVNVLRMDGKKVEKETRKGVMVYFALYMILFFGILFLVSFDQFDFETSFSAVASCFNNVGPGFSLVGPMGNYALFSPFVKVVLSCAMLLGRLEIWPILLTLYPATWQSRHTTGKENQ